VLWFYKKAYSSKQVFHGIQMEVVLIIFIIMVVTFLKNMITIIGLIAIILFISFNADFFMLILNSDLDSILGVLEDHLAFTLTTTLVLMIIQNSFTVIPLLLLITVNIMIFGFVSGYLWSWLTSILAASLVFFAVRNWLQTKLLDKVSPKIKESVEQNGFMYVFSGRIFPFMPTSLINLVGGVSSVKFSHFFWGTAIGNFIYFFFLSLIPLGFFSTENNGYLFIVLFIALVLYGFYKKHKKRQAGSLKKRT
jgi:uncharacterized membrane protein YdjX (TVP38/TMEM64 family)